jgi:hypothetical protein
MPSNCGPVAVVLMGSSSSSAALPLAISISSISSSSSSSSAIVRNCIHCPDPTPLPSR